MSGCTGHPKSFKQVFKPKDPLPNRPPSGRRSHWYKRPLWNRCGSQRNWQLSACYPTPLSQNSKKKDHQEGGAGSPNSFLRSLAQQKNSSPPLRLTGPAWRRSHWQPGGKPRLAPHESARPALRRDTGTTPASKRGFAPQYVDVSKMQLCFGRADGEKERERERERKQKPGEEQRALAGAAVCFQLFLMAGTHAHTPSGQTELTSSPAEVSFPQNSV